MSLCLCELFNMAQRLYAIFDFAELEGGARFLQKLLISDTNPFLWDRCKINKSISVGQHSLDQVQELLLRVEKSDIRSIS